MPKQGVLKEVCLESYRSQNDAKLERIIRQPLRDNPWGGQ